MRIPTDLITAYGKVRIAPLAPTTAPTHETTRAAMDNDLHTLIVNCLNDHDVDSDHVEDIATELVARLPIAIKLFDMRTRLEILLEYERSYLGLIKEFKEEIKFAGAMQEDLRKERAKFFSETLKDVASTLKESQVDSAVSAAWIKDLVGSYTKSLDLSGGLIEEQTIESIGKIREQSRNTADAVKASAASS